MKLFEVLIKPYKSTFTLHYISTLLLGYRSINWAVEPKGQQNLLWRFSQTVVPATQSMVLPYVTPRNQCY